MEALILKRGNKIELPDNLTTIKVTGVNVDVDGKKKHFDVSKRLIPCYSDLWSRNANIRIQFKIDAKDYNTAHMVVYGKYSKEDPKTYVYISEDFLNIYNKNLELYGGKSDNDIVESFEVEFVPIDDEEEK